SFPDIDSGRLLIVRGDCIGAAGEGNKLFKLRYNLPQDCSSRRPIVSVGGPWSNHLHALAHRCAELGLSAHGFVRGLAYASTPTIDSLRLLGMQLHHLDRV